MSARKPLGWSWFDELLFPVVLAVRMVTGKVTFKLAWWLLDSWWPFKKTRRLRMHYRVWMARRHKGQDEFYPSLDMDVISMMEMTDEEQGRYHKDLVARRERAHQNSLGAQGGGR